ncbi:MAG: DUF1922 domain-containing protein [Promethearchaeota archaeon]
MKNENLSWKKDTTPYIVFKCEKCNQHLYAKKTQKTKKCLKCGRIYQIKNVKNVEAIVKGMTNAVNKVKEKQNELAIKELGCLPDLRTSNDFFITFKSSKTPQRKNNFSKTETLKNNSSENFKHLLLTLSHAYKKFPGYMIQLMAEDYDISPKELKILIKKFIKEGKIKCLRNNYYILKLK